MDNTFILQLLDQNQPDIVWSNAFIRKLISLFNRNNKHFELCYKKSILNEKYREEMSLTQKNLLQKQLLSVEQAINIYHLLNQVILMQVPGDIVELGCYEGTTAILLQMILDQNQSNKQLHVYDSFQGLPEPDQIDGLFFTKGRLKISEDLLKQNFIKHKVKLPHIHPGFFKDTLPTELPEKIAFAHLDGDLYSSIKESLQAIYDRLTPNALVVIDDYCDPHIHNVHNILPGVKVACDEFFSDKPEKISVLLAGHQSHGYFRKI